MIWMSSSRSKTFVCTDFTIVCFEIERAALCRWLACKTNVPGRIIGGYDDLTKNCIPSKRECRRTPVSTVTKERLERALALAAYLVVLDGPIAAPIFERLERELKAMQASEDTADRAKRLLESYTDRGGLKAIR
jgi:hypothetical protein